MRASATPAARRRQPGRETLSGTVSGLGAGTLDVVEEADGHPDGSTRIDATIVGGTADSGGSGDA